MTQDRLTSDRGHNLWAPFAWLGGLIAAGVAVAVGALLAVFTAAAVAVFAVVAGLVVFLGGIALRARRAMRPQAATAGVIEARKVGDTWVTYGWDRAER